MTPDWLDQFSAVWLSGFVSSRRSQERIIYAMSEGSGMPVKIGITRNLDIRWQGIRSHTWRDLYLCWTAPGAAVHEAAIKHILNDAWYRCEWFHDRGDVIKTALRPNSTSDELRDFINSIAFQFNAPPHRRDRAPRKPSGKILILPHNRVV